MAGSSTTRDARHRFLAAILHAVSCCATCVSLFATGRSEDGLALAAVGRVRIGVIWTHGCNSAKPCWGSGSQAAFFHAFLLGTHVAVAILTGLMFYHSLITRSALRHNVKARLLGLASTTTAVAVVCGCLLLLTAVGYGGLEAGMTCPALAMLAETVAFAIILTLWTVAPPARKLNARLEHAVSTADEEAAMHRNGWWINQQWHLSQSEQQPLHASAAEEKPRITSPPLPRDPPRTPPRVVDADAKYGSNADRLTIGQIIPRSGASPDKPSKDSPPIVSSTIKGADSRGAPRPTFLEPPVSNVAVAPSSIEPTLVVTPQDLFGGTGAVHPALRPAGPRGRPSQRSGTATKANADAVALSQDLDRQRDWVLTDTKEPKMSAGCAHLALQKPTTLRRSWLVKDTVDARSKQSRIQDVPPHDACNELKCLDPVVDRPSRRPGAPSVPLTIQESLSSTLPEAGYQLQRAEPPFYAQSAADTVSLAWRKLRRTIHQKLNALGSKSAEPEQTVAPERKPSNPDVRGVASHSFPVDTEIQEPARSPPLRHGSALKSARMGDTADRSNTEQIREAAPSGPPNTVQKLKTHLNFLASAFGAIPKKVKDATKGSQLAPAPASQSAALEGLRLKDSTRSPRSVIT